MTDNQRPLIDYATPAPPRILRIRRIILLGLGALLLAGGVFYLLSEENYGHVHGEPALPLKCLADLKSIGTSLLLYANEHQNKFPDSLDILLLDQDCPTDFFVCPGSTDTPASGPTTQQRAGNLRVPGHSSYVYVGKGLTSFATADFVLVYETLSNHGNGRSFLFGDGHAEFIPNKKAMKIIAELQSGHNPPRAEMMK